MKTPQAHPLPAALIDLVLVAAAVAGFFSLSLSLELSERVAHWTHGYERWQLDDLPLTLLSAKTCRFGWHRWRELALEIRARCLVPHRSREIPARGCDGQMYKK